jgi:predicted esterase
VSAIGNSQDPHANQPLLRRGPSPSDARLVAIFVHGRGGSAEDILSLADQVNLRDVAYIAPQAAGRTWYPYSFLAPLEQNEPGISSGLRRLSSLVDQLSEQGVPPERVGLLGFSQGACLALEFAARHPRRYAAVVGLSGGLISPPGTQQGSTGSLLSTPVFLGCSDIDPHIPLERVRESANVFRQLGAVVDERIYPHMGHTVSRDEILAVQALFGGASAESG